MTHQLLLAVSRGTSPTPSVLGDGGLTPAERRARKALEYEEDEGEAPPAFVREAEVPVPNIPLPRASDRNVRFSLFECNLGQASFRIQPALDYSHAQLCQV